jgi:hypothetical protein
MDIQSVTRRTVLPLIEIIPGPLDNAATVRAAVDKPLRLVLKGNRNDPEGDEQFYRV